MAVPVEIIVVGVIHATAAFAAELSELDPDLAYFPYLIAQRKRELACTWFSGRGTAVQAHAGMIAVRSDDSQPRFVESPPLQFDAWRRNGESERDTGGEYLGITVVRGGGFAAISPIQNIKEQRFGLTWMKFMYSEKP